MNFPKGRSVHLVTRDSKYSKNVWSFVKGNIWTVAACLLEERWQCLQWPLSWTNNTAASSQRRIKQESIPWKEPLPRHEQLWSERQWVQDTSIYRISTPTMHLDRTVSLYNFSRKQHLGLLQPRHLYTKLHFNKKKIHSDWKHANITTFLKKGDRSDASNHRSISLTSVCSKVMLHVLHSQIMNHLEARGILAAQQHGFMKQRSCEMEMLTVIPR